MARRRGSTGWAPSPDACAVAGSVAFRGGGFAPRNLPLAGVVTLLGLVAPWQVGDWLGLISTLFLPAPAASLWRCIA